VIIALIAAIDEGGGIGKDGGLPWHLSDDLKNFKRLTMGHHILMGRNTYRTVAGKLKGRNLIVLSRDENFKAEDARVARGFAEGIRMAEEAGEDELFIIGGAEVFKQALPLAQRFYLTRVHSAVESDTHFPEFSENDWREIDSRSFEAGEKNDHAFTISVLERI